VTKIKNADGVERLGDCYEWALTWLLAHQHISDAKLVHGRATLTRAPFCQFGHAWIELNEYVLDHDKCVPKKLYYEVGKIDAPHSIVYEQHTAFALAARNRHCGPWEGVDAPVKIKRAKRVKR